MNETTLKYGEPQSKSYLSEKSEKPYLQVFLINQTLRKNVFRQHKIQLIQSLNFYQKTIRRNQTRGD